MKKLLLYIAAGASAWHLVSPDDTTELKKDVKSMMDK
jgi:hypothetical protein